MLLYPRRFPPLPMPPTTRRQSALTEGRIPPYQGRLDSHASLITKNQQSKKKHDDVADDEPGLNADSNSDIRPSKRVKHEIGVYKPPKPKLQYQSGTIDRGHIYFLYRPRVELIEVNSIQDIRNFHIILVPRPPEFAVPDAPTQDRSKKPDPTEAETAEMKVLVPGADAVPASDLIGSKGKNYRLITIGKKKLPDPEASTAGGSRKKEIFWASVTSVGSDFATLDQRLGERSYETKTRGTRHEAPVRLVARGGYAIVNSEAETPSRRETHLGYCISHPDKADFGDVQKSLGIFPASSFVLQVKNPLAPATGPQQAHSKGAEYPSWIMQDVFGAGADGGEETRGREHFGLRFVSCETPELLNYEGAQLLLIAARDGEQGLEKSLGEGRGAALTEKEEEEAHKSVEDVFEELGLDLDKFPVDSLDGSWI